MTEKLFTIYYYEDTSPTETKIIESKGFVDIMIDHYRYRNQIPSVGGCVFVEVNGRFKLISIECGRDKNFFSQAHKFSRNDLKCIKKKRKEFYNLHSEELIKNSLLSKGITRQMNQQQSLDSNSAPKLIIRKVENTSSKPYCFMGYIRKKGLSVSGILIDKNIILTSATIIYDSLNQSETPISDLTFITKKGEAMISSKIRDVYYPPTAKKVVDNRSEWAILYLESNLEEEIFLDGKEHKYCKLIVY